MRQRSVFDNFNPFMKGTAIASMNNSQRQSTLTSSLGQAGANISRTGGGMTQTKKDDNLQLQ
jgi:hypothetical protein